MSLMKSFPILPKRVEKRARKCRGYVSKVEKVFSR